MLVLVVSYTSRAAWARCWGRGIAVKMAKRSSEEFQEVKCQSVRLFLFVLLSSDSVSVFDITLGLLLLQFSSRTNFFTRPSPPGRTSTRRG